jgi:hypothetical protein
MNIIKSLECLSVNFFEDVQRLITKEIDDINTKLQEEKANTTYLKKMNTEYENTIMCLQKQVEQLTVQLQASEDEQRQLLKVSHVVSIEKENAKLKKDILTLENKLNNISQLQTSTSYKTTSPPSSPSVYPSSTIDTPNKMSEINSNSEIEKEMNKKDKTDQEETTQDETQSMNVKEKVIKGKTYYISDDKNIYIKNEDESIGELVGKIVNKIAKWF